MHYLCLAEVEYLNLYVLSSTEDKQNDLEYAVKSLNLLFHRHIVYGFTRYSARGSYMIKCKVA